MIKSQHNFHLKSLRLNNLLRSKSFHPDGKITNVELVETGQIFVQVTLLS